MKSHSNILLCLVLAAAALAGCQTEEVLKNTPAVDVTTRSLEPSADESGTVRAYIGTRVTCFGFNLDKVGAVRVGGADASIVERSIKQLTFEIPQLELSQQDAPHSVRLEVFDADCETPVFTWPYYVTVPVTDALVTSYSPKTGTIGTEITISGRNLSQVTSVKFNDVEVVSADFAEGSGDAEIKVALPVLPFSSDQTPVSVKAVWSAGDIIVADGETAFTMLTPYFNEFTRSEPFVLGDEFTLEGRNLDLVQSITWGNHEFLILDGRTATSLKVAVPTNIDRTNPAVTTAALSATFGTPPQSLSIVPALAVDTTPKGPAEPVFGSIAPTDTGYDKIFFGRELTVTGENMASVEKFIIASADGSESVEAVLDGTPDDRSARFTMPAVSGNAKREMTLVAVWNGGNKTEFGTITVYPFMYTRGLRIGVGSGSVSTYTEFARENAFLVFDRGEVMSVQSWQETPVDPYALTSPNSLIASGNKLAEGATADQYYSALPYTMLTANSANKLAFQNPSNSNSQLKCHRYPGSTSLLGVFGTPNVWFRVIDDDADFKASVVAETLEDITAYSQNAGAAAPACAASEASGTFVSGSVICVQYAGYDHAHTTGGKITARSQVRKIGYIYIRDITCADANGAALADRSGYVEFDLYWSNVLN